MASAAECFGGTMRTGRHPGDKYEPFSIYGDEAEYTVSKEKVLVIFGRYLGND